MTTTNQPATQGRTLARVNAEIRKTIAAWMGGRIEEGEARAILSPLYTEQEFLKAMRKLSR